jgi:hypothetical protein
MPSDCRDALSLLFMWLVLRPLKDAKSLSHEITGHPSVDPHLVKLGGGWSHYSKLVVTHRSASPDIASRKREGRVTQSNSVSTCEQDSRPIGRCVFSCRKLSPAMSSAWTSSDPELNGVAMMFCIIVPLSKNPWSNLSRSPVWDVLQVDVG